MAENQAINYCVPLAWVQTRESAPPPILPIWLQGKTPDLAAFEQHGLQLQHFYSAAIYQAADASINGQQFAELLQIAATWRGIDGPVMPYENSAVLFHLVEEPRQTMRLKRQTEEIRQQITERLNGADVCCGVGRPARGLDNLRQSFSEAESSVRLCNELHTQSRSIFFGNSSVYRLLLSSHNSNELQRFYRTWLADLIAYDKVQHSYLLETLGAYFENNGHTALTAKQLNIHRNTLANRLNRIGEIACLDLDDVDVQLNLHLALKAYELLRAMSNQ